eukprot:2524232-Rhodomonas_salina.2
MPTAVTKTGPSSLEHLGQLDLTPLGLRWMTTSVPLSSGSGSRDHVSFDHGLHPKSNIRNCTPTPGTNCADIVVSCVLFRPVTVTRSRIETDPAPFSPRTSGSAAGHD